MHSLAGKIVLITGGNKGLGFEAARRLRSDGHTVYIGARDPGRGEASARELGVQFVRLDVTDEEAVTAAAERIAWREGRIDVLVNNAGILSPHGEVKGVANLSGSNAIQVFDTNVAGIVRVTNAFLPLLESSDSPAIVNVSSGVGSFAVTTDESTVEAFAAAREPLYSASKAAVNMLTAQYAKAFPRIRVNAADPGYTATDFNSHSGTQTVTEGTDAIVELASLGPEGPTGTFINRHGRVDW